MSFLRAWERRARGSALLVAMMLLLVACGSEPEAQDAAPPTPDPVEQAPDDGAPVSEAPSTTGDWRAWEVLGADAVTSTVALDPSRELWLESVASGPSGLVAVGYGFTDEGQVGEVWHSPDGSAWTQLDLSAILGNNIIPRAVVHGPGGYVAVGIDFGPGGLGSSLIIRSTDGVTWEQVPTRVQPVATQDLRDVTAVPGGYVAVGHDSKANTVVVLVSSDGVEWTRSTGVSNDQGAGMYGVAPLGEGSAQLLGVGWARDANGFEVSAWWFSGDGGVNWERLADSGPANINDGQFVDVAGTGSVSAMVGKGESAPTGRRGSSLWVSTGGQSWSDLVESDPLFQGAVLDAVEALGPLLLVLGEACLVPDGGGDCVLTRVVWGTEDGTTWEVHPIPVTGELDFMFAVAPIADGFVAVGQSAAASPTFWRTP